MEVSNVLGRLAEFFGAGRYQPMAASLQNEGVMVLLYSAGWIMYALALAISGVAFLTLARRCSPTRRSPERYSVIMSGPTLTLYGISALFLAGSGATSLLVIYVGVWRLDIAMHFASSAISDVAAIYTAWAVWGPQETATDIRIGSG